MLMSKVYSDLPNFACSLAIQFGFELLNTNVTSLIMHMSRVGLNDQIKHKYINNAY